MASKSLFTALSSSRKYMHVVPYDEFEKNQFLPSKTP